ncbi:MAG: hypothetical protein ACI9BW_002662 [Gammaproteobacteria bacterium]|jgi:hypothetical protein
MIVFQIFSLYSSAFHASLIDPELGPLSQTGMDTVLGQPFIQEWWSRQRTDFLEKFRKLVGDKVRGFDESKD